MDWNSESEFFSSDDNSYDSDVIDSDIEANLYSIIHYQETSLIYSNEYLIQKKIKVDKSNSSKQNKIKINDITGKINCVEFSQKPKNSIEVRTVEHQNEHNKEKLTRGKLSLGFDLLNDINSNIKKEKMNPEVPTIEHQNELNKDKLTERKLSLVSDASNDIKSNIKTKKMSPTNNKNKISNNRETLYKKISDNNSNISLDPKNTEKHFQTNSPNHTVPLVYSSDSIDRWFDNLSNESRTSFSNQNLKDLWYINDEDLYRFKLKSESDCMKCNNCNQKGHIVKNCPFPIVKKCYLCGNHHNPVNCKNQACAKCFSIGHNVKFCPIKGVFSCTLCSMTGHSENECPDFWRRYHLTTFGRGVKLSKRMVQREPIFCYNCGVLGHFGGYCMEERLNVKVFQTWPIVISYTKPYSTYKPRPYERNMINESFIDFEAYKYRENCEKKKRKRDRKIAKRESLLKQQKNLLSTIKREASPNKFKDCKSQDLLSKQRKKYIKQEEKEKRCIRKLELLRENLLAQANDIPFPLLDLSGQKELPYSYKSLRNRAKKERKQLKNYITKNVLFSNISCRYIANEF